MAITPRQLGALALLALVPLVTYYAATGRLTTLTIVIGAVNVVLIAATVMLAFSPTDGTAGEHAGGTSN